VIISTNEHAGIYMITLRIKCNRCHTAAAAEAAAAAVADSIRLEYIILSSVT